MSTFYETSSSALVPPCELTSLLYPLAWRLILIKCLNLTISPPLLGNKTEHHIHSDATRHVRNTVCWELISKYHPVGEGGTDTPLPKSSVCGSGFRIRVERHQPQQLEWTGYQNKVSSAEKMIFLEQEISLEDKTRASSLPIPSTSVPVSSNIRESEFSWSPSSITLLSDSPSTCIQRFQPPRFSLEL